MNRSDADVHAHSDASAPRQPGRRRVLGAGLAALAGAPALASAATAAPPVSDRRASGAATSPRARNVIFMVSDGMSQGAWTLGEMASRARRGQPSAWARLLSEPGARRGQSSTHSADSLVTDSAAAGSAWGIGRKVANGAINITPDGREYTPLLRSAQAAGRRTGLVTTTEITHATPASFAANVLKRSDAATIGRQLLERRIDVLLGGGAGYLPADELAAGDVRLVRRADELTRAAAESVAVGGPGGRLVGLFARGHLPYELDRPDTVPTLAAMTDVALRRLLAIDGGEGFVLQVEGGRVDHAAHANDAGALVADQLAFDDAVAVAMRFVAERDDTLLVVTTDHGNANPGLTLYGDRGNRAFEQLLKVRKSFDWIWSTTRARGKELALAAGAAGDEVPAEFALEALVSSVRDAVGVEPTADDRSWLARSVVGTESASAFRGLASRTAGLGQVLANHVGVGFVSVNHTTDLAEVTAIGPGASRLEPLIDNVDLHRLVLEAMRLPA